MLVQVLQFSSLNLQKDKFGSKPRKSMFSSPDLRLKNWQHWSLTAALFSSQYLDVSSVTYKEGESLKKSAKNILIDNSATFPLTSRIQAISCIITNPNQNRCLQWRRSKPTCHPGQGGTWQDCQGKADGRESCLHSKWPLSDAVRYTARCLMRDSMQSSSSQSLK